MYTLKIDRKDPIQIQEYKVDTSDINNISIRFNFPGIIIPEYESGFNSLRIYNEDDLLEYSWEKGEVKKEIQMESFFQEENELELDKLNEEIAQYKEQLKQNIIELDDTRKKLEKVSSENKERKIAIDHLVREVSLLRDLVNYYHYGVQKENNNGKK